MQKRSAPPEKRASVPERKQSVKKRKEKPQKKPPKRRERPPREERPPRRDGIFTLLTYAFFHHFQKRYGGFRAGCICIFSLYFAVAAVFFGVHAVMFFGNTIRREDVAYLYTDGTEDEKHPAEEETLPYESVFRGNGEPYVNFTDLSEILNLITVGSSRQIRFSLPDEPSSSALFVKDSCNVTVNGCNAVVMSSPARIVGRTVYVPLSFLQNYTEGFSAAYDPKENRMTMDRLVDKAASTEAELVHIRFRYTLGSTQAAAPVLEEEVFP